MLAATLLGMPIASANEAKSPLHWLERLGPPLLENGQRSRDVWVSYVTRGTLNTDRPNATINAAEVADVDHTKRTVREFLDASVPRGR